MFHASRQQCADYVAEQRKPTFTMGQRFGADIGLHLYRVCFILANGIGFSQQGNLHLFRFSSYQRVFEGLPQPGLPLCKVHLLGLVGGE